MTQQQVGIIKNAFKKKRNNTAIEKIKINTLAKFSLVQCPYHNVEEMQRQSLRNRGFKTQRVFK